MKRAVRRFMPGETLESALDAARAARGGRHRHDVHAAGREPDEPRRGRRGRRPLRRPCSTRSPRAATAGEVSVKPTQLGLDLDADRTLAHLTRLAEKAAATGSYLWIDMEGSDYVEATIRLYERLRAVQPQDRHLPPGVPQADALGRRAAAAARPGDPTRQGRLRRAERRSPIATSARSMPAICRSRSTSSRPVAAARSASGSARTTSRSIEQIAEQVDPAGVPRDGFEVEMLYGIRSREQYRLAKAGYRVQTLIAYGEPGTRGTCAGWPNDRPTSPSRSARCLP